MQLNDICSVSQEVVAREVGGEMVLLNLSSGLYFGLDIVGGRIWELLSAGPQSVADLCNIIEQEFDAPRDRIESDMLTLVDQLTQKELIVAQAG